MKKPKLLFDKDNWLLGEHIPDCDIFFFQIPANCFSNDRTYPFVKRYRKFLGIYKKFDLDFYVGDKDSFKVAESIIKALVERPKFGKDLDKNIIKWSDKLIAFSKNVARMPLSKYSNKELWQIYEANDKLHTKLYTYGWIPVAVDLFHNNFTNKLKSYLYTVCENKDEAEKAFILFTTPYKKTIVAKEREEFLAIYERHKKNLNSNKVSNKLRSDIEPHAKKWGHLGYIYAGNVNPFGREHYISELRDLAKSKVNASKLLAEETNRLGEARKKQQKLYRKLRISSLYRRLFSSAQDFAISKLYRRHAQLLNLYLLHISLLTEISKRLGLSRYQVQFMLKGEVKIALLKGKVDKKLLLQRLNHCVFYTEKGFVKMYKGRIEEKLRKLVVSKVDKNLREIVGQIAQPGFAKGKVKIIFRAKDMKKFKKGDILVSVATDPDVVPAMKKAGAIVTDQGGITSHAAIVSRELGTPCIIGTKIATKIFKDGDMVEVDANKGIVRKI